MAQETGAPRRANTQNGGDRPKNAAGGQRGGDRGALRRTEARIYRVMGAWESGSWEAFEADPRDRRAARRTA